MLASTTDFLKSPITQKRFPNRVNNVNSINQQCTQTFIQSDIIIIIIIFIIHEFITRASSVMVLNQRPWQSLGGQHGKDVDGLFEKVSFQNWRRLKT